MNLRGHKGQEFKAREFAGLARWVARWALRLPFVEKERPHSLQGNGRSPKCVAWCKRRALGQLRTRRHTPHWLGEAAVADVELELGESPAALAFGLRPRAASISLR